jgi:acetyl-CoA carboxylase biotin carboxyl carrier protein
MNRHISAEAHTGEEHDEDQHVSVEQLQHLVQLLDKSEVSEIEIKRADAGTRLVLRKALMPGAADMQVIAASPVKSEEQAAAERKQTITAQLVGFFHPWTRPGGKAAVSVGDTVKKGQLIGSVQSLNVISEIESLVAGRVAEILVQDGQAVEYGQPLMIVDSVEEA